MRLGATWISVRVLEGHFSASAKQAWHPSSTTYSFPRDAALCVVEYFLQSLVYLRSIFSYTPNEKLTKAYALMMAITPYQPSASVSFSIVSAGNYSIPGLSIKFV